MKTKLRRIDNKRQFRSKISLGGVDHSLEGGQELLHAIADEILEHFPHVFGRDVEVLPDFLLAEVVGHHLLVASADVVEVDLVDVLLAVFADLPEDHGGDGVVADVELSAADDAFAHFDHRSLLGCPDFSLPADAHDHVLGLRDGDELDLVLEEVVELAHHVPPRRHADVRELANVELLEVVLLLKARRKDRVAGHVFD